MLSLLLVCPFDLQAFLDDQRIFVGFVEVSMGGQSEEIVDSLPFAQWNVFEIWMFQLQMLNEGSLRSELSKLYP